MNESTQVEPLGQAESLEKEALLTPFGLSKRRKLVACAVLLLALSSLYAQHRINHKAPQPTPIVRTFDQPIPELIVSKVYVEKSTELGKSLAAYNISATELAKMIKAAKAQGINMAALKPKQFIEVRRIQGNTDADAGIKEISFMTGIDEGVGHRLKLTKVQSGSGYRGAMVNVPMAKDLVLAQGHVKNSIFASSAHHDVSIKNLIDAARACGHDVNFQQSLKNADSFEVLVEKFTAQDDQSIYFGKTIYFGLTLAGRKYKIYKFKTKADGEEFYTPEYKAARRGLSRTPVQKAKITSRFCVRIHPLLGYSHNHKGVDFAAPQGTPIQATGPGVITAMGFKSCMGNYLKIKHNDEISTLYAHASRFAKNLSVGSRVKQGQTIAFIGMTGRATGPHLHYGLIYQGKYVDPLKFKTPPLKTLRGSELEVFKIYKAKIDAAVQRQALPQGQEPSKI